MPKGVYIKSEEHKRKISLTLLGKFTNENNPSWKGNDVGYYGLHKWINKYLPKPKSCEFCNQEKKILLAACITGVYNRDFKNWKYLCARCHVYYDGTVYNLKPKQKKQEL